MKFKKKIYQNQTETSEVFVLTLIIQLLSYVVLHSLRRGRFALGTIRFFFFVIPNFTGGPMVSGGSRALYHLVWIDSTFQGCSDKEIKIRIAELK